MIIDELKANVDYIIKSYNEGKSTHKLAKEFNCNTGTIWYFLTDNGVKMRQRKKDKVSNHYDKVVRLYNEGATCGEIARQTGFADISINRYLRKLGFDTGRYDDVQHDNLLKDKKDQVIEMYKNGESTNKIAKILGYSVSSVLVLLNKNGIRCRDRAKYSLNHNFFDVIDNEFNAYVMGFMFADGTLDDDKHHFRMFQNEDDAKILFDIQSVMQYTGPIYFKKRLPPRKNMYTLQMHSKQCVKSLIEKGCVPNKSLILDWPKDGVIGDNVMSHMLRGYFDGDGSLSLRKDKCHFVAITSNDKFCFGLNNYVKQKLGIEGHHYYRYGIEKSTAGSLMFCRKAYCKTFLDFIYSNLSSNSLYLQRKYDRYLNLFYK